MIRRALCLSLFGLSLLGVATFAVEPTTPPRPNIVLFLLDDLGWSDVGFHGSEIQTAHIDTLAHDGARLEAFYVQPVCSPTRAALMTGRYPLRHGLQVGVVRPWAQYGLPLEERTLPQALKEVGYATAITGKWHLGHFQPEYLPTHRGFDQQLGHYNGMIDYFTHIRDGGFDWHRNDQVNRDEGYSTVLIGNEAVRVVNEHAAKSPLFLYVPFNAPHAPLQAPQEYLDKYATIRDRQRRPYAAMVHCVDDQIGRIVAAIEQRGWTENTLFIFSSDNGGPTKIGATNGKLRAGKGTLYEGGTRVAAFATWRGKIPAGVEIHEPLHMVDWYPTLLKLAGASTNQPLALDGRDIWPVLTQQAKTPHDEIVLNVTPNSGAIRVGDWKLVVGGNAADDDGESAATTKASSKKANRQARAVDFDQATPPAQGTELFNLAEDPSESKNLVPEQAERVRDLYSRLRTYAQAAVPPKSAPKAKDFRTPAVWGENP